MGTRAPVGTNGAIDDIWPTSEGDPEDDFPNLASSSLTGLGTAPDGEPIYPSRPVDGGGPRDSNSPGDLVSLLNSGATFNVGWVDGGGGRITDALIAKVLEY